MNDIAFIQGRLVNTINNNIQAFPREDWMNELSIASSNNINFIELTVDLDRIWENPIASSLGVSQLNDELLKYKIKPLACTADFIMHNPPWISHLSKLNDISKKIIENLGEINCKFLVIPLVDDSKVNKDTEDMAINFLLGLEPFLIKNNVEIAIESDYKPKDLIKFINKLPPEYYGINYDIGNSASLGYDVEEEFDTYFERIKHIHVKDRLLNGTTVPLGQGNADFELCFKLIKKYNYKGDFSMQTARDESDNHLEVMLKYINMTKGYMNVES